MTEEDVRRIVKEEIQHAIRELIQGLKTNGQSFDVPDLRERKPV
jgi:hypothetical protein